MKSAYRKRCPAISTQLSAFSHKLLTALVILFFLPVAGYRLPVTPAHSAADSLYFIHTDHLGSTVAVTDEDGEIVSQNRHFPYGEDRLPAVSGHLSATERNYTSQIKDNETQLYYYNARYYDPALGTFVSADPADDSLNRYGYVHGSPLAYVDPSGSQGIPPGISASGIYNQTTTSVSTFAVSDIETPSIYTTTGQRRYPWTFDYSKPTLGRQMYDDLIVKPASDITFDAILEDLNTIERIGKTMVFFGYADLSFQAFNSWRAGRAVVQQSGTIENIASVADARVQAGVGEGRVYGGRFGACGYASHKVWDTARSMGARADAYQVADVQAARGVGEAATFRHTFAIVHTGGDAYIMDLSFNQFVDPSVSSGVHQGYGVPGIVSSVPCNHPGVQTLMETGYIPLNPSTLEWYLEATSAFNSGGILPTMDNLLLTPHIDIANY